MRKIGVVAALLLGLLLPAVPAKAVSATPRAGLLLMDDGTTGWGQLANNWVFKVADSSFAVQGLFNYWTASNTVVGPWNWASSSITLTGSNGFVVGQSSFSTLGGFFGDGSHLSGLPGITALTGDGTASGPGSAALTLATVNTNTGSCGDASHIGQPTLNGKGLATSCSPVSILIAESQVSNLSSDLSAKASSGTNTDLTSATNLTKIGAQSQALNMNSHSINNVTDPSSAQDAVTLAYLQSISNGLQYKASARLATTSALPSLTYNNGSSGVGATLTGAGVGILNIDGIAACTSPCGDRILVKNQASPFQNGIYTVTVNAVASAFILTRTSDFNQASEMVAGAAILIDTGAVNDDAFFISVTSVTTVGTDSLVFQQINGLTDVVAGTGLSLSGNTMNLVTPVSLANGGTNNTTGQPSGSAGGSLAGSYPNPTLTPTNGDLTTLTQPLTVTATGSFLQDVQAVGSTGTFNSAFNVSWSTAGPQVILVMTGNVTSSAWIQAPNKGRYELILCQDGTGGRTFAWPSNVVWPQGGTAPTLTVTPNKCDFFPIQYLSFDGNFHMLPYTLNN